MSGGRRDNAAIIGVGAVACATCCAGPVLAFLGGLGLFGLGSTAVRGAFGLTVFLAAGAAYLVVRRHRSSAACASPHHDPVPVAAPTLRPT